MEGSNSSICLLIFEAVLLQPHLRVRLSNFLPRRFEVRLDVSELIRQLLPLELRAARRAQGLRNT